MVALDWRELADSAWNVIKVDTRDYPGSPVAETLLPTQGIWVQSLVRELAPTCLSEDPEQINMTKSRCCKGIDWHGTLRRTASPPGCSWQRYTTSIKSQGNVRQTHVKNKATKKTAGLGSSETAMLAKTTDKGKKDLEMVITLSEGSQRQSSITDMLNLTWYKRTDLQNRNRLTDCKNKLWLPGGEVGRDILKV